MFLRKIGLVIAATLLFSNMALAEKPIQIGDRSGYTKVIPVKDKDMLHVCDLDAFIVGFAYTYMAMWNTHMDNFLQGNKSEDEKKYYLSNVFYSEPNVKASLSGNPKESDGYSSCKSNSFQQGKMIGFLYELEDIRSFKEYGAK